MKGLLLKKRNVFVPIDAEAIDCGGSWHIENGQAVAWDIDLVDFFFEKVVKLETPLVLDIGACTGSFSLLPVAHPGMTVVAFEPHPSTCEVLDRNIQLNGLEDKVTVFPYALSDFTGEAELFCFPGGFHIGLSRIKPEVDLEINPSWPNIDVWPKVAVEVRTLDSFAFRQRVDLIKIDAEGCELEILLGGRGLIERDMPGILFEYRPDEMARFGQGPGDIFDFLADLGYKSFERIITLPKESWNVCDVWATRYAVSKSQSVLYLVLEQM